MIKTNIFNNILKTTQIWEGLNRTKESGPKKCRHGNKRRDNNQFFNSLEAAQGKKVHLTFFVIDVSIQ